MAVAVKSSGVSTPFSIRIIDASDLEHTGLSDFISSSTTVYTMDLDNADVGNVVYFNGLRGQWSDRHHPAWVVLVQLQPGRILNNPSLNVARRKQES